MPSGIMALPQQVRRIAVIGAGPAGLASVKYTNQPLP